MEDNIFIEAVCPSQKCRDRRQRGASSSSALERLTIMNSRPFVYSCDSCGNRSYFCNMNNLNNCSVNPTNSAKVFREHMETRHRLEIDEDLNIVGGDADSSSDSGQSIATSRTSEELGFDGGSFVDRDPMVDDVDDGDFNDDDNFVPTDAFFFEGVTPLPLPAIGSYRQESLPVFPAPIRPGGPSVIENMDIPALLDELIATGLIAKLPAYVFWENGGVKKQTVDSYNVYMADVLEDENPGSLQFVSLEQLPVLPAECSLIASPTCLFFLTRRNFGTVEIHSR